MHNDKSGKSSMMRSWLVCFFIMFFLCVGLSRLGLAASVQAKAVVGQVLDSNQGVDCATLVKMYEKQNHKLNRELGQIKREIAALRVSMHGVTLSKIFGGIGYILGLFGVAAMVDARHKNSSSQGRFSENSMDERG